MRTVLWQCVQAAAEGRRAAEEEAEGLRVALTAARTAADAARAQLTAEQIGAQQRLAAFEKLKQELEVHLSSAAAVFAGAEIALTFLGPGIPLQCAAGIHR